MNKKVEEIAAYYNSTIFTTTPIKELRVLLRNTTRKEIGYQFYRPGMVTTGSDFNSYGNLAHEIAHHWWRNGDYVKEPWIDEGLANYCMLLVLEKFDTTARNRIIASYKKSTKGLGPISGTQLFSMNAYSIYYMKSALVLWDLDKLIGRKRMIEVLTTLNKEKKYSEKLMLDTLEKIAGTEAAATFSGWLKEKD